MSGAAGESRLPFKAALWATAFGLMLGLAADLLDAEFRPTFATVFAAIVLSPIAVVLGGPATTVDGLRDFLTVCGVLFWPVYGALLWVFARARRRIWVVFIAVWCLLGFFQIAHRSATLTV